MGQNVGFFFERGICPFSPIYIYIYIYIYIILSGSIIRIQIEPKLVSNCI